MIFKDKLVGASLAALAVVSVWSVATSSAFAEQPAYSRATKDLPVGTILSKANIRPVSANLPHPQGAISGCSILYGCRIYAALGKNQPVTDAAVCAGRWTNAPEPKSDDPAWVKAQKAAEIALKADDLDAAMKDCDTAIVELEHLADSKQRITDFTEMSHLLIPYTEVELATWRTERHKHGNLEQRTQSLAERAKKELSQSERLLAAMKKLLPVDNFYVVTQAQDVQHKSEDLKTSEHLASMAKSLSGASGAN